MSDNFPDRCSCNYCERDYRVIDCIAVVDMEDTYLCPDCEELIKDFFYSYKYLKERDLV